MRTDIKHGLHGKGGIDWKRGCLHAHPHASLRAARLEEDKHDDACCLMPCFFEVPSVGSETLQCDSTGQCVCKPGVTGLKCDKCKDEHFGFSQTGCR